ncbi:MAG: Uma2 family endonuclease, partial [Oscillatoria sp. PMC 1068.18]|nr:Uma2 family endonuclease [Oscillatoria sp. PMC 1068.18]
MSPNDTLKATQDKMKEYLENQVKLGWLLNPKTRSVEIYRLGEAVEVLANPTEISGENVLPGFVLKLAIIWGKKTS